MIAHGFRTAALAASLALAGCLGSETAEDKLRSIEALQAKNLPMTDEQKSGLAAHLEKGREALSAGNEDAARTAFDGALKILKIAQDAALYNKAD